MFSVRGFFADARVYGFKIAFWNLRFAIGHDLLPGIHKHITVTDGDEKCDRCSE
jgi:hypothetical protein